MCDTVYFSLSGKTSFLPSWKKMTPGLAKMPIFPTKLCVNINFLPLFKSGRLRNGLQMFVFVFSCTSWPDWWLTSLGDGEVTPRLFWVITPVGGSDVEDRVRLRGEVLLALSLTCCQQTDEGVLHWINQTPNKTKNWRMLTRKHPLVALKTSDVGLCSLLGVLSQSKTIVSIECYWQRT